MHRKAQHGFTLIELMVVVTIMVIIVSVATPSFRGLLQSQQVKSMAFDLTSDLLLARSEALKRNANVALVRTGTDWNNGWSTRAAGALISTRNKGKYAVTVTDAPLTVVFDANGRVFFPTDTVRITLESGSAKRCVELGVSGRAKSTVGACA